MKLQCRPCKDTLALVKKNAYGKDELVSCPQCSAKNLNGYLYAGPVTATRGQYLRILVWKGYKLPPIPAGILARYERDQLARIAKSGCRQRALEARLMEKQEAMRRRLYGDIE